MLKPGGHGAIWKLMLDKGVFKWLDGLDRQAALVRQIRSDSWTVDRNRMWDTKRSSAGKALESF